MSIDRKAWISPFPTLPRWLCSRCGQGHLRQQSADAFTGEETKHSRVNGAATEFRPEWTEHRFATLIKCDNKTCREPHSVTGRREGYEDCVSDIEGNYWSERLHVDSIVPAPMPIHIPASVPDQIAAPIRVAAMLYWADRAAAGNALRQAVERFLDFKGVKASEPRANPTPGRRSDFLSLEKRLADYRDRLKGDPKFLSAVRHLGNVGSHNGELDHEHVLLAFEMIENVLEDQFVGTRKRLEGAAALIERSRGRAKPIN